MMADDSTDRSELWSDYGYRPAPGAPIPDEGPSDSDDDQPDPTHECVCGRTRKHIQSAPASEYSWCDECGRVKRFERIGDDE